MKNSDSSEILVFSTLPEAIKNPTKLSAVFKNNIDEQNIQQNSSNSSLQQSSSLIDTPSPSSSTNHSMPPLETADARIRR